MWWWQEQGEDVLLEEDICGAAVCGVPLRSGPADDAPAAGHRLWVPLVLVATNLRLALMLTSAAEDAQELARRAPRGVARPQWADARGRWDSLCGVWNVVPLGMVMRASKNRRPKVCRYFRAPAECAHADACGAALSPRSLALSRQP